jgi:hypothetical protein
VQTEFRQTPVEQSESNAHGEPLQMFPLISLHATHIPLVHVLARQSESIEHIAFAQYFPCIVFEHASQ